MPPGRKELVVFQNRWQLQNGSESATTPGHDRPGIVATESPQRRVRLAGDAQSIQYSEFRERAAPHPSAAHRKPSQCGASYGKMDTSAVSDLTALQLAKTAGSRSSKPRAANVAKRRLACSLVPARTSSRSARPSIRQWESTSSKLCCLRCDGTGREPDRRKLTCSQAVGHDGPCTFAQPLNTIPDSCPGLPADGKGKAA
jgi:hypothetical protein